MHASILKIDKATILDAGQYTCQAIDRGVQQCKSLYVQVKNEPDVKITPMSTTVEKVKIPSKIRLNILDCRMNFLQIGFIFFLHSFISFECFLSDHR